MNRESEAAVDRAISPGLAKDTDVRLYPTHEEIAHLAYSLYESRGRQEGRQIEDWVRAEQQLVHHYA